MNSSWKAAASFDKCDGLSFEVFNRSLERVLERDIQMLRIVAGQDTDGAWAIDADGRNEIAGDRRPSGLGGVPDGAPSSQPQQYHADGLPRAYQWHQLLRQRVERS